ncbi:MAG: cyclodeaminase [Gammaproteobacteria bacterium]|nr:cyclodeaminase [Gammaproteobacteria bacterium]
MSILVLTEAELRQCARIDATALAAVEDAFTWLTEGRVMMPPIMHIEVAAAPGDVDIKSAYVNGLDSFAVKIGSGFFGNSALGLPNSSAMMVVLSAQTGFCEAVLLDNGYLTDLRTGLAGAVVAKYLAPERVATVGVIGVGAQARYQVRCLQLVRDFERIVVFGRDPDRTRRYADDIGAQVDRPVEIAESAETVVRAADLLITTTPSREPIIRPEWLHQGLHITAMGSDLAGKQELAAGVLAAADRVVCDRREQCIAMGELQYMEVSGDRIDAAGVAELGDLTTGRIVGRERDDAITICDLTGTGVQDTAIARVAMQGAGQLGFGVQIES